MLKGGDAECLLEPEACVNWIMRDCINFPMSNAEVIPS